jgi:hypothetical protein
MIGEGDGGQHNPLKHEYPFGQPNREHLKKIQIKINKNSNNLPKAKFLAGHIGKGQHPPPIHS